MKERGKKKKFCIFPLCTTGLKGRMERFYGKEVPNTRGQIHWDQTRVADRMGYDTDLQSWSLLSSVGLSQEFSMSRCTPRLPTGEDGLRYPRLLVRLNQ